MPLFMTPPTERVELTGEWYDLKTSKGLSYADLQKGRQLRQLANVADLERIRVNSLLATHNRDANGVYSQEPQGELSTLLTEFYSHVNDYMSNCSKLIALFLVAWCHDEVITLETIQKLDEKTFLNLLLRAYVNLKGAEGVDPDSPLGKPSGG